MPGKSDIASELGSSILHREQRTRDSLFTGNTGKLGQPSRATRNSVHAGNENAGVSGCGLGRRSPRAGGATSSWGQARKNQSSWAPSNVGAAAGRLGSALNDITNVAAGRNLQALSKSGKQAACDRPAGIERQAGNRGAAAVQVRQPAGDQALNRVNISPESPSLQVDQIDSVQSCSEYATEIYNNLFREEVSFMPRANYMDSQGDINGKMRAILVDWLVEVHMKYRLRIETLYLTVNLIDRYLSRMPVKRKRLQLVGVVAMFIAAKFEEINPPEVHDFVHITDNAYTKEDLLVMECTMLSTLGFQIAVPTAAHFMERLQKLNKCSNVEREMAEYLLELSMIDIKMLRYEPSCLVSAALLMSNEIYGRRPAWPQHMAQHSRRSEETLRGCADELHELMNAAPTNQLQAVRKKFSQPEYHCVGRTTL